MKKPIFILMALAALIVTGCSKESGDNGATSPEEAKLVVKIDAAGAASMRSVDSPATNSGDDLKNAIVFSRSEIFVFGKTGTLTFHEPLVAASTTSAGQELGTAVEAGSTVFVVANLPQDDYDALSTWAAAGTSKSSITGYVMTGMADQNTGSDSWKSVTLANETGKAIAIGTVTNGKAYVAVNISPMVSRLELVAVTGGEDASGNEITDFQVTGVYVDDFFPRASLDGLGWGASGTSALGTDKVSIGVDITKLPLLASTTYKMGDENASDWVSAPMGMPALPAVSPDDTDTGAVTELWGYNVASNAVPRFIVEITGVKYTTDGGATKNDDLASQTFYLTVTGYTMPDGTFGPTDGNPDPITGFQRANVYRIGTATNPFEFTLDDLGAEPNQDDITLTAKVTVVGWTIELPTAEL